MEQCAALLPLPPTAEVRGKSQTGIMGVFLDLCVHRVYFWVLFINQIQNA